MLMTYFISGDLIADVNLNRDSFEEFILGNLSELNLNAVFVPEESLVDPYCSTSHLVSVLSSADFFSKNEDIIYQSDHFLRLCPALTCSFVTFDRGQFDVTFVTNNIPPRVKIIVDANMTKVNISDVEDLNMVQITEDGNLNICHEVLDREFKSIMSKKVQVSSRETGLSRVKYLMNLILVCVSMLALTLTIITYLKFPSLQNLAGRNNIFLCFTLLLAQLFLIVGSEITTIGPVCTTIGVCIHFCWIWAFTWTFICSYSMFKVFTSKTRPSHKSNSLKLQTIKRFLISLAVPIVIIASVVIISMVTTNGHDIGYGTTSCFLDTAILTALSVVVPLALIVIINLLFLFITIGTIYKIRKFQSLEANRKDNLKNLFIYIKLSSMTGGFWLLGIIATATQSDIIEFISILLNGLQGCFIFLSYICNRRVLSLYLPEQKPEKTSIVSTNMSSELKCISQ
ncbi:adhesion G protein-coupled receptor E2-like [Biomphalaria glabrata]|uniref:Adhesion G protein-coupled receptor E2-like n=1 Tax=Biomphalaria glabrata TaxID=6526 RepID=A0A9W2ZLC4_BIOGL|nr:adhesion G protein-coupled receptor E2-like [Biomphalaria glabrata]